MRFFVIFTVLTVITSFSLFAQEEDEPIFDRYEISAGGGVAYPYLPVDFHNIAKSGYDYTAGVGAFFSPGESGYTALYLTIGYDYFGAEKNEYLKQQNVSGSSWDVSGGETNIINVNLDFKATFSNRRDMVAPYFLVGVGYMNFNQKSATISDGTNTLTNPSDEHSTFSWQWGIGLDFPITEDVTLFQEYRYILGLREDVQTQHLALGGGIRLRL